MFVKSLIFQTWKTSGAIRSTNWDMIWTLSPLSRYECETPDFQFYQRGGRWCWKSSRELGQSGHHNSKNKIQSVINWILQSSQIGILFVFLEEENIFLCGSYMYIHYSAGRMFGVCTCTRLYTLLLVEMEEVSGISPRRWTKMLCG